MRSRNPHRGSMMIELLVASLILGMVMSVIYAIFRISRDCYAVASAQVEAQQNANIAANQVARDLMEAEPNSIEFFPRTGVTSVPVGVVFISARNGAGQFQYDTTTGYPNWQRYVSYYLDADPQFPGNTTVQGLWRAELTPSSLPNLVAYPPSYLSPALTTANFRSSGLNKRLIIHGVKAPVGGDHGGFDVYSKFNGTKSYDRIATPVYLDLNLFTTASLARKGPAGDTIQVSLQVLGRS